MLIREYKEFLKLRNKTEEPILENLQTAKLYLRKKVLDDFKKRDPELKISVTDLDSLEKNPATDPETIRLKQIARRVKETADNLNSFTEVKRVLTTGGENSPNFAYVLTRFMEDEGISNDPVIIAGVKHDGPITTLYKSLKGLSQYLKLLPMPIDRYAQVVPDSSDLRTGSERLIDDLEELTKIRATDRFVKELPGQFVVKSEHAPDTGAVVPSIKEEYANAPAAIKDKVKSIAVQFDKFEEGDPAKNKKFRDSFWAWVRFWARDLRDIITSAQKHLDGALMNEIQYLEKINEVNKKYGEINGAEIILFKDGVLVTRIKSFQANVELNGDTSHCIVKYISQWENYVSGKGKYNIQYYIRNFNLGAEDDLRVVGITIDSNQIIEAAFNKPNRDIGSSVKNYIKDLGIDFKEVFKPMTEKDVQEKKNRDLANDNIVKDNLTIDQIKEYLSYGADPNASDGKPLQNAVASGDVEKVKFLIEQGALPVIGSPLDRLKNRDSDDSIKIATLLIAKGAKVKFSILEVIMKDYNAMKDVLEAGFKVNQDQGLAMRRCISACEDGKLSEKETLALIELLIEYGADVSMKSFHAIKMAGGYGKMSVLKLLIDESKKAEAIPTEKELRSITSWVTASEFIEEGEAEKIAKLIIKEFTSA